MSRKVGFVLMGLACLLAALFQWRGILFIPKEPPKVTSVMEYTKPDGTIVHRTSVEGHAGRMQWYTAVPLCLGFIIGVVLVSFGNRSE